MKLRSQEVWENHQKTNLVFSIKALIKGSAGECLVNLPQFISNCLCFLDEIFKWHINSRIVSLS